MKTLARIALLGASLIAAACAPPAPPAAPPPPPAPRAEPPSPTRSAGLQVVFDLKKTPIPVSYGEASIDLQPMAGRTFVTIQDVLFYIDGDTLRSDPALQRGLSEEPSHVYLAVSLGAMGGHWPDAAWAQVAFRGERFFSSTFLRWGGDQWVAAHTDGTGVATAVVPLAKAWSLVILRSPWSYISTPGSPVALLHPRLGVPVRQLEPADSAATLPDGSLYTAVDGHVRLWGPDGSPRPLPSPSYGTTNRTPVTSELVALSPSAVYLLNVLNEDSGQNHEPARDDRPEAAASPAPALRRPALVRRADAGPRPRSHLRRAPGRAVGRHRRRAVRARERRDLVRALGARTSRQGVGVSHGRCSGPRAAAPSSCTPGRSRPASISPPWCPPASRCAGAPSAPP